MIATIFVLRDSYRHSMAAAVTRMAATSVSFVLCLIYLPFHICASISSMPDTILRTRLDDLGAEHRHRSRLAGARRSAAVESIELDWAVYQLGCHYDDQGDLDAAARWYRMAAASDFADAALRLGCVLDMLASQRTAAAGPGYGGSEREALVLVSDAARWYAEAFAAGHPEAAERLDGMISRHDPDHPRLPAPPRRPAQ